MKDDTFYISGKISIPVNQLTMTYDSTVQKFFPEYDLSIEKVYIEKVVYSKPATIVFWSDGTKTVSKCHGNDIYTKETGLAVCIMKKCIGATETKNIFIDWLPEDDNDVVRLSDVRRKIKARSKK